MYKSKGDIFAADVLSHKNCMKSYLLQYQRKVQDILSIDEEEEDSGFVQSAFSKLLEQIHLLEKGYALSTCREIINSFLNNEDEINNRRLKNMLISEFGEEICFSFSRDKTKSQMFYSSRIKSVEIVETLRSSNPIIACAEILHTECKEFDFGLDNSYCDAKDVKIAINSYKSCRPNNWELFFDTLIRSRKTSDQIKRKTDTIFQIFYNLVSNK